MKNHRKEEVSKNSDNPDDNSQSSGKKWSHLDVSEQQHSSAPSGSDSDSEKIPSAIENSKNKSVSGELTRTNQAGDVVQDESVSLQSTFSLDDLTSEDEVYTLQCPSVYNKQDLLNKNIDFTKPNQTITTEMEVFQFELMNLEKKFITLAVPKNYSGGTLINLPLKGHIVIHKVIDTPNDDFMIKDMQNKSEILFPQDIKTRHPLLGVNWQDHLKIAKKAMKNISKKHKSIKKEKVLVIKEEKLSENEEESVPQIKDEFKKLKRKRHGDEASSPYKQRKKNIDDNIKL